MTDRYLSGFEWMATMSTVAASKFDRVHRQGAGCVLRLVCAHRDPPEACFPAYESCTCRN